MTGSTDGDRDRLDSLRDPLPALAILAGLRLDLFTAVAEHPRTVTELAAAMSCDERRLEALLRALEALDLVDCLEDDGGRPRFLCTSAAARWLCTTSPEFDGHDHALAVRLWAAGLTVAEAIRLGQPTARHAVGGDAADTVAFLRSLHPGALATGQQLGRLGWLDGCRHIVDVGGGSGGLAIALHRHLPEARVLVLERPEVAPVTRQFLADEAATVDVVEGDIVTDGPELDTAFDPPCDGIVCCSLLQVLAPRDAARAVRRMTGWLAPGGRFVLLGMGVLADDRVTPRDAALGNILFGTLYDEGRAYTVTEYRTWMQDAGLEQIESVWLDDGRGALRGVAR